MYPSVPAGFDFPKEFPILSRWHFFNHAGVAPISLRAAEAMHTFARQASEDAYMTGHWYRQAERARILAARLIGASAEEIAFTKNTSEGIAFVANGLSWQAGDEIISTQVEYPANVYPWMDLEKRLGVKVIRVPEVDGRIPPESILEALTPRTRLVALSQVEFGSGFRQQLEIIGPECRKRGVFLLVDGIQACGVLPVNVELQGIDFLSADGHKWMMGPEGCGIFYCRRAILDALRPEVGWMNMARALEFDRIEYCLRPDARRFECGSYNIPGILALGAALELLADLGIDWIWQRVDALNGQLCAGLEKRGYRVFSPRGAGETSGIVSFTHPCRAAGEIVGELEKRQIILACRQGRLRASPHFYNTPEQIDHLLEALP